MKGLLALLLAAAPLASQPVIRVTTRLVEVDVVARDRNGAVADLTKDDFTILDQDKPRPIAYFEKVAPKLTPRTAPAPNVFTNDPAGPNAGPAVSTVVLLDLLNGAAMDQYRAKPDLVKFLRGVPSSDRVAIFSLSGGVQLEQNFTGDAKALTAAVERGRWGAGMLWPEAKREAYLAAAAPNATANAELARLTTAIRSTFYSSNADGQSERVRATCIGLSALARYLGKMPGRKNLLWITAGIPLTEWGQEPKVYVDEVSQADHALNDAHVSVYPIDVAGLLPYNGPPTLGKAPDASERSPFPDRMTALIMGGKGSPATRHTNPNQGFFNYVARFTGGKPFVDGNGVFEPLKAAAADSEVTYLLGFYADSAALDGRRHVLKVDVRRRGVELRHRQGYTATADDPATRLPSRAEIEAALWTPIDAAGISISATVEPGAEAGSVRLRLRIPARDVDFDKAEEGWTGTLALLFMQRSAADRDLGRIAETLTMRYDDAHFEKLPAEGIEYTRTVRPSADGAKVRVVICDRRSGRLGSLTLPLSR